MELNTRIIDTPPRPAASVILLRDGVDGLEVFLVKRHGLSDTFGGAFVFPGGKIDQGDRELEPERHLDRSEADLQASLHEGPDEGPGGVGLYVGALRELFEECGVLCAEGVRTRDVELAASLLREGRGFDEVLAMMALRLQTRSMQPWSRWITPRQASLSTKRFDTRFFLSALPEGQQAVHDNREAVDSVWVRPLAALQAYWQRQMDFAPPQIMSLAHLSRFGRVQDAFTDSAGRKPPLIQPEPFEIDGERTVTYPGDPLHPIQQRAMPGPTRLVYRNRRFEPPDGFDSLFAPEPAP
jgi:8-oxo-dGTP pyrophosphatase MutT (NUDIX family)